MNKKRNGLILIHGLAYVHKWSANFLASCLEMWGPRDVFVVYSSAETGVVTKNINGRVRIVGGNGNKAGIDPINHQVTNGTDVIQRLQDGYGLHPPFFTGVKAIKSHLSERVHCYFNCLDFPFLHTYQTPSTLLYVRYQKNLQFRIRVFLHPSIHRHTCHPQSK